MPTVIAAAIDERYTALVLVAGYMGLRPSELVGLRVDAGIGKVHPYALRHSAASIAATVHGTPPHEVGARLGHRSPITTAPATSTSSTNAIRPWPMGSTTSQFAQRDPCATPLALHQWPSLEGAADLRFCSGR